MSEMCVHASPTRFCSRKAVSIRMYETECLKDFVKQFTFYPVGIDSSRVTSAYVQNMLSLLIVDQTGALVERSQSI